MRIKADKYWSEVFNTFGNQNFHGNISQVLRFKKTIIKINLKSSVKSSKYHTHTQNENIFTKCRPYITGLLNCSLSTLTKKVMLIKVILQNMYFISVVSFNATHKNGIHIKYTMIRKKCYKFVCICHNSLCFPSH